MVSYSPPKGASSNHPKYRFIDPSPCSIRLVRSGHDSRVHQERHGLPARRRHSHHVHRIKLRVCFLSCSALPRLTLRLTRCCVAAARACRFSGAKVLVGGSSCANVTHNPNNRHGQVCKVDRSEHELTVPGLLHRSRACCRRAAVCCARCSFSRYERVVECPFVPGQKSLPSRAI